MALGRFYRVRSEGVASEITAAPGVDSVRGTEVLREPTILAGVTNGEAAEPLPNGRPAKAETTFVDVRVKLHRYLLDRINLRMVDQIRREELIETIRPLVKTYVRDTNFAINSRELDALISDIADEMLGLGPIEPLLKDDAVADILINTHRQVYVERRGVLEPTPIQFKDEDHLLRVVNKIVAAVGRRVDESAPMVDARLPDGSRVNVAVRPIAVDGPLVSIRKFSRKPLTLERLVESHSLAEPMRELLAIAVRGRVSLLVSGGTGSGKTTLLNALSTQIPATERLITIEDAAELQLQQPHVARMETRPPNMEGRGEVRQRELVKNALRMRPDRIIVGEVRGEEAFDMLQAMNTGHEGSMTTIHANNPRDAISRLEQMIGMAGMPMSQSSIRHQIASAIDIIVQTQRLADGARRVVAISEITGMEGDVVQMQDIFTFVKTGLSADDKILGEFRATGIRPRLLERLSALGFKMGRESFDPVRIY